MKTKHILGILCVSWAVFALPAAAQNGRQATPATSGICDGLADATPGLQGLCVAMCEAQGCEAELNPDTGQVEFGRSCEPSAERLLANYNRLAGPGDPSMPCVKVACPCWTQAELQSVGGFDGDKCRSLSGTLMLQGGSADRGIGEFASTFEFGTFRQCASLEFDFNRNVSGLSSEAMENCTRTLRDECTARGLWP